MNPITTAANTATRAKDTLHALISAYALSGRSNYSLAQDSGLSQPSIARIIDSNVPFERMHQAVESTRTSWSADSWTPSLDKLITDIHEHEAGLRWELEAELPEHGLKITYLGIGEKKVQTDLSTWRVEPASWLTVYQGDTIIEQIETPYGEHRPEIMRKLVTQALTAAMNALETERISGVVNRLALLERISKWAASETMRVENREIGHVIRAAHYEYQIPVHRIEKAIMLAVDANLNPDTYKGQRDPEWSQNFANRTIDRELSQEYTDTDRARL